jgi:hypothetical protein
MLEQYLAKKFRGAVSTNWNEMAENPKNLSSDELIVRNTYLNAVGNLPKRKFHRKKVSKKKYLPIQFNESINVFIEPGNLKELRNLNPMRTKFKSAFKGSKKVFNLKQTRKKDQQIKRKSKNIT